jgi:chromosome segregation ATPase
MESEVQ